MTLDNRFTGGDLSSALEYANLKDQIARVLRAEIVTGRMRPGTTYKMGELAERFGASRTPIREAILELEAKGLVEITRGVGFAISTPTPEELANILDIREMLEVPVTAAVAGKLDARARGIARELLDRLTEAAERNDLAAYLDRDHDFHQFLVSVRGNPRLTRILGDLRDVQRVPGLTQIAEEGNLRERNKDHVALLEAIEHGDTAGTASIIRKHLQLSWLSVTASSTEPRDTDTK